MHQRSLKETFQKYPEPEELIQCVTWDDMQAALLGETESTPKVRQNWFQKEISAVIQSVRNKS